MSRRYWEWPQPFTWEPTRTALLIIDMQQGFVEPGAPLEVPMARDQVPTIATLLRAFRDQDLSVFHTRFVVKDDEFIPFYRFRAPQRGLEIGPPRRMFHTDGSDAFITADLAPVAGEPVVDKIAYDGFADTALESLLRSRDVDTLVIAGTVVNWCVDSTLRAAFHRRFQCIVVADGVSGYDHAGATGRMWVDQELDLFAECFAVVLPASDVLACLEDPNRRAAGGLPTEPGA